MACFFTLKFVSNMRAFDSFFFEPECQSAIGLYMCTWNPMLYIDDNTKKENVGLCSVLFHKKNKDGLKGGLIIHTGPLESSPYFISCMFEPEGCAAHVKTLMIAIK